MMPIVRTTLGCLGLLLGVLAASPAWADMTCVQQELTDLGFDPGPVDGAIGKRTMVAASLFAANAGLEIAPLDASNAELWCAAIKGFAATPAARTISRLDLASEPAGILSEADQKKLWNAYATASQCLDHPAWGGTRSIKIKARDAAAFAGAWTSPFPPVTGSAQCRAEPGRLNPPAVIQRVKVDEKYGERLYDVDNAAKWFRRLTTYSRYSNDPVARQLVKDAIVAWARGGGLSSGIHVSYGKQPVDYQMAVTIGALVTATAALASEFTAEERAVVGPWLNDLVSQVAGSVWQFRYDNKPYMSAYIALLWALTIGDDATVQNVIETYKLAIHDMRPDGSFPVDSQRGGMGLVYGAASAGSLVNIATALKQARGIDLFAYSVDGRSVHTAVDFVVAAVQDPGGVNSKYAINCANAGDRFGSIAEPTQFFIEESSSYLLSYASLFPDRRSSQYIAAQLGDRPAMDSEKSVGAPACLYASLGGQPELAPLTVPVAPIDLPAARLKVASVVDGEEEAPVGGGASSVYLNLRSGIVESGGAKLADNEVNFTIKGILEPDGRFRRFTIVVNTALGDDKPDALRKCGAKTELDDFGKQRVVLDFAIEDSTYKAENIGCILKALPKGAAFEADFITSSMQDIAVGLVSTGDVAGIGNAGLRAFFESVARGKITLAKGEPSKAQDVASLDPAALPKPQFVVSTVEKFVKNSGKATEIISLLESRIKGGKKGQNRVEFTVLGHYNYSDDRFIDLSFIIQDGLGKDRPEILSTCPGVRTEFYDDQHHAIIALSFKDGIWTANKLDCLVANLPKSQAFTAAFLANSFRDIAIGLVKSGDDKVLENDGLRTFIGKVASGELTVRGDGAVGGL